MRRAGVGLVCAVALWAVAACESGEPQRAEKGPASQPTTKVSPAVGNLCQRVQPSLAGSWQVEDRPPGTFPVSDVCWLTDSADPANRFRISVSVLPVTAQDMVGFRQEEARNLKGHYVAVPVDGGVGPGSWAVNPAAVGPWLTFHSSGRLVRVAHESAGKLDAVKAVARTIVSLPGGLPAARAVVQRPECAAGTAAAEKLLGAKATARRDTAAAGQVTCLWGVAGRSVFIEAGGPASDAGVGFMHISKAASSAGAGVRPVKVGGGGFQQDNGYLVYRVGKATFVMAFAQPESPGDSAGILALARAMVPAFDG